MNETLFYAPFVGPNEARIQLLYDLAEIAPTLSVIQQLSFRQGGVGIGNVGGAIALEVRLATSATDPNAPSTTFAQNADPAAPIVFAGTVTLPTTTGGGWPQPWQVLVPLQTPFVLAPAPTDRALVIDVRCRNNTAGQSWFVEVNDMDAGSGETVLAQPSCPMPNGQASAPWAWRPDLLIPGRRLALTIGNYPNNQPSASNNALVLGLQGPGGTFGGQLLPASLSAFGIPSPLACQWTVDWIAAVPITYTAYSWGAELTTEQAVRIPANQALAGLQFFVQNAALMQYPNGLQVFPSVALQFTIGSGRLPNGSTVQATGNRNATTGGIAARQPISVLLQ
ncbi:MAG: hypothetical protein IPK26_06160 [Planctomycetes bacterium]|nr:hypothetical protein [Planctomycetota bacterium]